MSLKEVDNLKPDNKDFVSVPKASETDNSKEKQKVSEITSQATKKTASSSIKEGLKNAVTGSVKSTLGSFINTVKAIGQIAMKLPAAIVGTAVVAITSLIVGIVAAISGVVTNITPTLEEVPEPPIALVRSAATGNSDYEKNSIAHTFAEDDRFNETNGAYEMARRIWTTMSGFKQMDDPRHTEAIDESGVIPGTTQVPSEGSNSYIDDSYGISSDVKNKITYGLRGEQICAMLGNFEVESGLDPTSIEHIFDEPFSIGEYKQEAIKNDFVTRFHWGTKDMIEYFDNHKKIFKAGIGLAQWTDTCDDKNSYVFDINNPGRNTRLLTYSKLYGMQYYLNQDNTSKGWNSEQWMNGDSNTEGLWYDPRVQLAFMLDKSSVGDVGYADWLWNWSEIGEEERMEANEIPGWGGDELVDFDTLTCQNFEGWYADFDHVNGWHNFRVVEFDSDGKPIVHISDTARAIGDNTKDKDDFRGTDDTLESLDQKDKYYDTPDKTLSGSSHIYNGTVLTYDKWNDEKALKTNVSTWSYDDKEPAKNKIEAVVSGSHSARDVAFNYAEKSAAVAWHGRNKVSAMEWETGNLGLLKNMEPIPNNHSITAGHDFIWENRPYVPETVDGHATPGIEGDESVNGFDLSKYQHWGVYRVRHTSLGTQYDYGWISDSNPCEACNSAALEQYKNCFKYIYRYHLYRYTTLYYTDQFANEYEGAPSSSFEERRKNANKWFNMWWESSQNAADRLSEPNVYSKKDPNVLYDGVVIKNSYMFKTEQGYAQGIMLGIKRTEDNLKVSETGKKIYTQDYRMSNGKHYASIDTSDIAVYALSIAAADKTKTYPGSSGKGVTPCYKQIHDYVFATNGQSGMSGAGDSIYMSCDRSACTAIRWSGVDDNFPGGNTLVQIEYLVSSPRWVEIDWGGDENCLQPGDVLIRKDSLMPGALYEQAGDAHHIAIYVGEDLINEMWDKWDYNRTAVTVAPSGNIVEGSFGSYGSSITGSKAGTSYPSYHAFRCINALENGKSKYSGATYTP